MIFGTLPTYYGVYNSTIAHQSNPPALSTFDSPRLSSALISQRSTKSKTLAILEFAQRICTEKTKIEFWIDRWNCKLSEHK